MATLSDAEIESALADLPGWRRESGEIVRDFRFKDFVEAFGFLAQVAALQEQMDHHARITNTYSNVSLALSTHSEGGITEKDVTLARRVNERAPSAG